MSDTLEEFGPAGGNISCSMACVVPPGQSIVQVSTEHISFAMQCPNEYCGRWVRAVGLKNTTKEN